ncbi:MAG: Fic family protein [Deltaproteobacteria bacterium]|jgi:hypothetical protein|nr:Fic family protein [Deltaproteobacteria bacterium]
MSPFLRDKIVDVARRIVPRATVINAHAIDSFAASLGYLDGDRLKIAAITRSLAKNHCFSDGNKRTAFVVLMMLCEMADIPADYSRLGPKILEIAANDYDVGTIAEMLFGDIPATGP